MTSPADAVVILSRLQFAITTLFHILWPVLTIGLSLFLVVTEALWLRTGDIDWYHHSRFWGRLFLLNFGVGVVMSGRRPLIKGFFRRCADRGCGHVFGLSRGEFDPLALMLSADPLPPSRERA